MLFAIVNESTNISPLNSSITRPWLEDVAAQVALQLNRDVAAAWGGRYGIRVIDKGEQLAPGEILFCIVDNMPGVPGAIAYHDVNGTAVPIGFLALTTCRDLDDVSVAISHEFCETAGDPGCNRWCDDGNGKEWALELCDADEDRGYRIGDIMVSNFMLPNFFVANALPPYTYMGSIGEPDAPSPFQTMANGYQVQRTAGDDATQVQGAALAHRAHRLTHWSTRVARRRMAAIRVSNEGYSRKKYKSPTIAELTTAEQNQIEYYLVRYENMTAEAKDSIVGILQDALKRVRDTKREV